MRSLVFILIIMVVSTSSHSSAKMNFTSCSDILLLMNHHLRLVSNDYETRSQLDPQKHKEGFMMMSKSLERNLDTATKWATIYNAKYK